MKWRACCAHVSTYDGRLELLVMRRPREHVMLRDPELANYREDKDCADDHEYCERYKLKRDCSSAQSDGATGHAQILAADERSYRKQNGDQAYRNSTEIHDAIRVPSLTVGRALVVLTSQLGSDGVADINRELRNRFFDRLLRRNWSHEKVQNSNHQCQAAA
jgi:hypothetical protein